MKKPLTDYTDNTDKKENRYGMNRIFGILVILNCREQRAESREQRA